MSTLEGISVAALGAPRDRPLQPPLPPHSRGDWDIRVIAEENTQLLDELETGATSLWLRVDSAGDVGAALVGVLLDLAPVVLDVASDRLGAARALLDALGSTTPALGTNLGVVVDSASPDELVAAAEWALQAGTLACVVDAVAQHDLGMGDAGEIAYGLAMAQAALDDLEAAGIAPAIGAQLIEFRLAATAEQFVTIAKFRAARRAWSQALSARGVAAHEQCAMRIHAVTSRRMMTRYDPHTNLLRTTLAAFGAAVGGSDAITVLPYDSALGRPDADARRLARNISSLLQAESHVGLVDDPAAGAYALEDLTDAFARAALTAGSDLINDARAQRIATRRQPITGVSEFPALDETPLERPGLPWTNGAIRDAHPFEQLRDAPAAQHVFVATMGPLAAHTARASFISNLFAAGGVGVDLSGPSEGPEDVVAAYRGQSVACLAGSDAAYSQWGGALIEALRAHGVRRVVLAGRPGEASVAPELVDDSAAMGVDALAFLARTREALQ